MNDGAWSRRAPEAMVLKTIKKVEVSVVTASALIASGGHLQWRAGRQRLLARVACSVWEVYSLTNTAVRACMCTIHDGRDSRGASLSVENRGPRSSRGLICGESENSLTTT